MRGYVGLCAGLLTLLCASTSAADPTSNKSSDVVSAQAKPNHLTAAAFAQLPFVEHAELSPDGRRFAGLIAADGRQIIAIHELFETTTKPFLLAVPDDTQADWVKWVNDDNILVGLSGLMPVEGDRWYVSRVIAINRVTHKLTRIFAKSGGQNAGDVIWIPSDGSNQILLAAQNSIYLDTEFWPAVYKVDVTSGRMTKQLSGRESVMNWIADASGQVRAGIAYDDLSRSYTLLYRDGTGSFRTITRADTRKREGLITPFLFQTGSQALVMHDDEQGNNAIYQQDVLTQKDLATTFTASKGEVEDIILSDDRTALLGVTTTQAEGGIHWIDPALADLQASFDKAVPDGKVRIESMNRDRTKMLVRVSAANWPGALYYYDVEIGRLIKIAPISTAIGNMRLSSVKMVDYPARDGLRIEGVLTLPKGREPHDLPFIIMPHGGPWGQDTLTYDYWAQFLASLGYAVLQPNFRGSTGYGTEFLRKGEGQLGLAMQDDVTDGVRWAVNQGIADPKRVCIVGASYGGYAAMWGIVKDPDLYRCAISIAGVASLRREVNDFGGKLMSRKYRDDWQRMTPDFAAVSPLNAVDRIKTPLLLVHGKKDVTVDHVQSARMYGRMQQAGKNVEFVSLPLADHFYTREADRLTLLTSMEQFLAKYNPAR